MSQHAGQHRGCSTWGHGVQDGAWGTVVTAEMHERILCEIVTPLLAALKRKRIRYRGVIYVGLMITNDGPRVLEFNARFGDPECQPIMMRLKSDLVPLLQAAVDGRLDEVRPEWHDNAAVCVVLTANGYPGTYDKNKEISGLENLTHWRQGFVFHAGTVKNDHRWLTVGGRVLGVTARGKTIAAAAKEAYWAVEQISWDGMRVDGSDFFAALVFPVGPKTKEDKNKCVSFVAGGWGGMVLGISAINHQYASENETTRSYEFMNGRWYRFRLSVTPERIQGWIDDQPVVDQNIEGRKITTRSEVVLSKPFGFATWETKAALRWRLRAISARRALWRPLRSRCRTDVS